MIRKQAYVPLIVFMMAAVVSACTGTRAAYRSAETLEETAKVMTEHFIAVATEVGDYRAANTLPAPVITRLTNALNSAEPAVRQLQPLSQAYSSVRSAENEQALGDALGEAAVALSSLIDILREVRQ